ncbi:MAG: hypothetical protein RIS83_252, partial [Pseudomonadota bacterium]
SQEAKLVSMTILAAHFLKPGVRK